MSDLRVRLLREAWQLLDVECPDAPITEKLFAHLSGGEGGGES